MIRLDKAIESVKNIGSLDAMFNLGTETQSDKVFIYMDNRMEVSLNLSKPNNNNRNLFAEVIYKDKDFKIGKQSSLTITFPVNESIDKNIEMDELIEVVKSCMSCNIDFITNVNFSKNGYVLEIEKTSKRYVSINEYINAVKFQKRFDSIDKLLNYIIYRKQLHSKVNISVSVSESEHNNIKTSISTMKANLSSLYENIIHNIKPEISYVDDSRINISVGDTVNQRTYFSIQYIDDMEKLHTIDGCFSHNLGISFDLDAVKDLHGDELKSRTILMEIAYKLANTQSGFVARYITIMNQYRKFVKKIEKVNSNDTTLQKNLGECVDSVTDKLLKAQISKQNTSSKTFLSSFKGFKRYIELDGVNKNRRHCDMNIYAQKGEYLYLEYTLKVEKNRIREDATKFLKAYFI
ncbi:hypothetical protein BPT24_091 [Tenacibaculum phage pT24]|uniref:Uncharacterized protein n=1 Tax=Tenacibaculum phage pT24 TaxID=1880590 RepID=A0A1B4XWN3_9CAUD|nr:hypothetical protein HYP10_gp091 [Tenacibaculum phage pT24]BAV39216.1 hypothetical protein BPT24_091 [Tenacibaculum phage pT24]